MVEVNRRAFLVGTGLAAAGAFAEDDKVVDGGFAEVTPPGVPVRARPVLPPWCIRHRRCRRYSLLRVSKRPP